MDEIIATRKRKPVQTLSPGPHGSVGSTQVEIEYRHSNPHMRFRFDPEFRGSRGIRCGSNVSDGQFLGYDSGGGPARVLEAVMGNRRSFKTSHGWTYTDIVAPDRTVDPAEGAIPDYTWHNQIAQTYGATHQGPQFLPPPGELVPANYVPRGGAYPQLVGQTAETILPSGYNPTTNIAANPIVVPHTRDADQGPQPTHRTRTGNAIRAR